MLWLWGVLALWGCRSVVTVANSSPLKPAVEIFPATPTTGSDLVVNFDCEFLDFENDPLIFRYVWRVDGCPFAEVTEKSIPHEWTTKAEVWEVDVSISDGEFELKAKTSVEIANTPPVISIALTPEFPDTHSDLEVIYTVSDADDDSLVWEWWWERNGQFVGYDKPYISALATSPGEEWTFVVQGWDDEVEIMRSQTVEISGLHQQQPLDDTGR